MIFLKNITELFADVACTTPLRKSKPNEPVRVLATLTPEGKPPGYCCMEDSHKRMDWYRQNGECIVQVGLPSNVGFARIRNTEKTDVPF